MSDIETIANLFWTHLQNPADPTACIQLVKQPVLSAQFLRGFVSDGRVNQLSIPDKVKVLALLGLCCRSESPSIVTAWTEVESDPKMLMVLRRSNELRAARKKTDDQTGASGQKTNPSN